MLKDLFFSIFAQDKTGTAFDSVDDKLAMADRRAAALSSRLDAAGKKMTAFGAAGSVASIGIAGAFRDVLTLYDEQEKAEARVAQAITTTGGAAGFTADQLQDQARALQRISLFADQDILGGVTSQLLLFGGLSGEVFSEAQVMAVELAAAYDMDLSGAADKVGKALANPREELEGLAEAGLWFTDTQKDMIFAMQEVGDLSGAQSIILDEMRAKWGGQAAAVREAGAGMVTAWTNTWADMKAEVGGVLAELLPPITDGLTAVAEAFMALSPEGKRFAVTLGLVAVAVPPLVGAFGLLVTGMAAFSAPALLVVGGLSLLTAGVAAFWPEIKSATEWIGNGLVSAFDYLSGAMDKAVGYVRSIDEAFLSFFAPIGDAAFAVKGFAEICASVFPEILSVVSETISAIIDWIGAKFTGAIQAVGEKVEWLEGRFAWLYDKVVGNSWVPDMVEEIGTSFAKLDGSMVRVTEDATGSVNDAFKGLYGEVAGALKSLAMDGELSWSNMWESLFEVGKKQADRIVSQVFDTLADGFGGALSSAFGGGTLGGAGGLFGGGGGGGLLAGLGGALGNLLGFDSGGAFTVRGKAGMDRNIAAVRLSEGEEVQVTRRGQAAGNVTNVYIQTQDADSFKASRAQVGRQISAAVSAGMRAA